jgi:hypothetical protein
MQILVLAGQLVEDGDRLVDLIAGVLIGQPDLVAVDAAIFIEDLQIVLDAGLDGDAGEAEYAGQRQRAAEHDVLLVLRKRRRGRHQRCRRRQRHESPFGHAQHVCSSTSWFTF